MPNIFSQQFSNTMQNRNTSRKTFSTHCSSNQVAASAPTLIQPKISVTSHCKEPKIASDPHLATPGRVSLVSYGRSSPLSLPLGALPGRDRDQALICSHGAQHYALSPPPRTIAPPIHYPAVLLLPITVLTGRPRGCELPRSPQRPCLLFLFTSATATTIAPSICF